MTHAGPTTRRLLRSAGTALLACSLSLVTIQQFGHGASEVLNDLVFRPGHPAGQLIMPDDDAKRVTLSRDSLAPICEAVLTERKSLALSPSVFPKPSPARPFDVFRNNCHPAGLRTRALFCVIARLRHILHPHLPLIAHTSSVLC